jgi:hypothetical protein
VFNYLVFFIAVALSVVSAYYSIAGLAVIFASAIVPVVVMASTLEAAKVVAASWLYRNWQTSPKLIKYYLITAVLLLMFITSMGIFGFLSKAHLDQTITSGDTSIELRLLEQQISSEEKTLQSAQNNLTSLDKLVDRSTDEESTKIRQRQKNERKQLADQITTSAKTIKQLNQEALPLRKQNLKLEAEVGPIKYIADLIYGSSDKELLEKAVRGVIILLVIVFDPLAIALLLAANHSLKTSIPPRRRPVVRRNGIVEIDKDSIARM